MPTEQPRNARLCPECEEWKPDTRQFFDRDYRTCKQCMDQRRMLQRQEQKRTVVKDLVSHADQLKASPAGDEIITYAVQIMGGPVAVAEELVALFNEASSPTVRKDILKTIVMGSIAAAKGKPKTDVSSMTNEALEAAIDARLMKLHRQRQQKEKELAPKLTNATEPGTDDPGLQPAD